MPSYFAKTPVANESALQIMLSRTADSLATSAKMPNGRFGPFEVSASPWFADLQSAVTMSGQHPAGHVHALCRNEHEGGRATLRRVETNQPTSRRVSAIIPMSRRRVRRLRV
jgi:DNA helicase-2/ATP-dependent DNA helicase PcrA